MVRERALYFFFFFWCSAFFTVQLSHPYMTLTNSGSFPMSQLFASGGQSIGVSASTSGLPMNTQD